MNSCNGNKYIILGEWVSERTSYVYSYVPYMYVFSIGLWELCENNFGNFDTRWYFGIILGIMGNNLRIFM